MDLTRVKTATGKREPRITSGLTTVTGKRTKGTESTLTTPRGTPSTGSIKRPKTSNALATKQWRQAHFHSGGPASRREVELLGEWLNSVLADNLDTHDNPLDIVTNAQHWFSVAFNELVRQVAVSCAERGRLFAVIWKRNQDLFSKLIEVQKQEREYILSCHKDRVQFLKTDLDFANSRLEKIEEAYNEEQVKWKESREKDITKFDSLQQKIDQQIADRKILQAEINELHQQLGMAVQKDEKDSEVEVSRFSYSREELATRLQTMKSRIRLRENPELLECVGLMDDVTHYIESIMDNSFNIRKKFAKMFLSIPESAKPTIRSVSWFNQILSYIYAICIHTIYQNDYEVSKNITLESFIYQCILHFFGNRRQAEVTLFDLLHTAKKLVDDGNAKAVMFLRFLGLMDPLPNHIFHYYLFCVKLIANVGSSRLFPEVEANDEMVGGIPVTVCNASAQKILSRFCEGRTFKFYTERIEKTANGGYLKFGGRPIAEYDVIMEYFITAYTEECHKIKESIEDVFSKLPNKQISTFGEFHAISTALKTKPSSLVLSKIMEQCMSEKDQYPIKCNTFMKWCDNYGLIVPFELTREDFAFEPISEDLVPFVISEFSFYQAQFDEMVEKLTESKDDVLVKQLKSAKVKFDQSLLGRSSVKIFESSVRELFEKIELYSSHVGAK